MSVKVYKSWSWEFDKPEGPLEEGDPVPESRAIVHLDYRGLPFRVVLKNRSDLRPTEDVGERVSIYDYFYGPDGRLWEKRSLDEHFQVGVMVRFEYDDQTRMVIESAWYPGDLSGPRTRKRSF